jgi:hypothetical protein
MKLATIQLGNEIEVICFKKEELYIISTGYGSYAYVTDEFGNYETYTLEEALEVAGYESIETASENGIDIEPIYN